MATNNQQYLNEVGHTPGAIGGGIVHFTKGDGLYWLRHSGQQDYLRDENGRDYVKFSTDQVASARRHYLTFNPLPENAGNNNSKAE